MPLLFTMVSRIHRQLLSTIVERKARKGTWPSSSKYFCLTDGKHECGLLVSQAWLQLDLLSTSVPSFDHRYGQWSLFISPKPRSDSPVTLESF